RRGVEIVGEAPFAAAVEAELDRGLEPWPHRSPGIPARGARTLRDAQGSGIAGLLGDLVASGAAVLAVCAHAGHRAAALRDRVGGFAATTWAALEDDPQIAAPFAHVVAIDPPPHAHLQAILAGLPGRGWAHLAWGGAERAFARRVHAWELDLRAALADCYRALRAAGAAEGAALEALLRGDAAPPRTGALAGRLVRVLAELGLVEVGRAPLRVRVLPVDGRTALEHSPAFLAYQRRLRDGMAMLEEPRGPRVDRRTNEPAVRAA
ncbi:MAG TPA: hypothetical protein VN213_16680, partial [Solirubrobacteraceae bacterium]|nr:hypothetical protein [Solirubrobacteraceae bacterium]